MSRHIGLGPVGFSGLEGVSGHSVEPGMGAREPPAVFPAHSHVFMGTLALIHVHHPPQDICPCPLREPRPGAAPLRQAGRGTACFAFTPAPHSSTAHRGFALRQLPSPPRRPHRLRTLGIWLLANLAPSADKSKWAGL